MKMGRAASALMLATALTLGGCGVFKGGGKKKTPTLGERVPILLTENPAAADPTIATQPVSLPPAQANAAWAQPGGEPDKVLGHVALAAAPIAGASLYIYLVQWQVFGHFQSAVLGFLASIAAGLAVWLVVRAVRRPLLRITPPIGINPR